MARSVSLTVVLACAAAFIVAAASSAVQQSTPSHGAEEAARIIASSLQQAPSHPSAEPGTGGESDDNKSSSLKVDLPFVPARLDKPVYVAFPKHSFRVGLGIFISEGTSMYTDGAKQTAIFIHDLLAYQDRHYCAFINFGDADARATFRSMGIALHMDIFSFKEALEQSFDLVMSVSVLLEKEHSAAFRQRGAKVVSYKPGNFFALSSEVLVHGRTRSQVGIHRPGLQDIDAVFTLPSFNRTNHYQSTAIHAPVFVAPYVWHSLFFDIVAEGMKRRQYYTAPALEAPQRIGIFEPNINHVKSSMVPLALVEQYYRRHPEKVEKVYITNGVDLREHERYLQLLQETTLLKRDDKIDIRGRFKYAWFLSEHIDVVVSHQWINELNYLHLETLYAGYPLVHNSPYIKECGYFYEGNDVVAGMEALQRAIETHGDQLEEYMERSRRCVWRFLTWNPTNLYEWDALLEKVYFGLEASEGSEGM